MGRWDPRRPRNALLSDSRNTTYLKTCRIPLNMKDHFSQGCGLCKHQSRSDRCNGSSRPPLLPLVSPISPNLLAPRPHPFPFHCPRSHVHRNILPALHARCLPDGMELHSLNSDTGVNFDGSSTPKIAGSDVPRILRVVTARATTSGPGYIVL